MRECEMRVVWQQGNLVMWWLAGLVDEDEKDVANHRPHVRASTAAVKRRPTRRRNRRRSNSLLSCPRERVRIMIEHLGCE